MNVYNRSCRHLSLAAAILVSIVAACAMRAAADEVEISRDALLAFQHYQTLEQPQFFALSADGKRYGYSYCPEGQCPRRMPARQLALDACQEAGGRNCRIIAAGKQPEGTFSPFGELTKDPLAEEMFRIMRDLVSRDQYSDEQLRSTIAAMMYLRHGALAYSAELDKWGVASEMDNRPMARETALRRCGLRDRGGHATGDAVRRLRQRQRKPHLCHRQDRLRGAQGGRTPMRRDGEGLLHHRDGLQWRSRPEMSESGA